MAATAMIGLSLTGVAMATYSSAQSSCSASYSITSSYTGGFNWLVTVTNSGDTATTGWTVTWTYANGQTIENPYNAVVSQSGANITATNESYNGAIAASGSTTFGGGGTYSGTTNSVPSLTCVAAGSSGTTTTTSGTTSSTVSTTSTTASSTTSTGATTTTGAGSTTTTAGTSSSNPYIERFLTLYSEITNPANGYLSPQGIPYHSVEQLMVEAPDQGHETTSEAYSYLLWLQAEYGQVTGNWTPFNNAWTTIQTYMIPQASDQPYQSTYNASSPAEYCPEYTYPSYYPSTCVASGANVGADPLFSELASTYGNDDIYGMQWIEDVDNVYGFGDTPGGGCELGPSTGSPSYFNTYQRGPMESVWDTIPQPTCDNLKYGMSGAGFLTLFVSGTATPQWKFTDAPDADARAVQAAYWAYEWSTAQGKESNISATIADAAKMGDYLRYSMYDKYFHAITGCTAVASCTAGSGKDSSTYLLGWYYAWGGSLSSSWSWRIGDAEDMQGYQNPVAAYALSSIPALEPLSPTAPGDWKTSLQTQLNFIQWLQAADGAIGGGATNGSDYATYTPPAGDTTFDGMFYDWEPVYHNPPSNNWFGYQAWQMERMAEYYDITGNTQAGDIVKNWVAWVSPLISVNESTGAWEIPSNLSWTGQPNTSVTGATSAALPVTSNTNLSVTVSSYGQDVGVAAFTAQTLIYYAAKSGDTAAETLGQSLLDVMWNYDYGDTAGCTGCTATWGITTPETRTDYANFDRVMSPDTADSTADGVYVPSGWSGTYPNGDVIQPGITFESIRTWYTTIPGYSEITAYENGGAAPSFNYHRFWAQASLAIAYNTLGELFPNAVPTTGTGTTTTTTAATTTTTRATTTTTAATTTTTRATTTTTVAPTTTTTRATTTTTVAPTTTTTVSSGACSASYAIASQWTNSGTTGGFNATVTVTAGSAALSTWKVTWTFANGQTVTSSYNAVVTQSGTSVTATNESYNGSLAAGASTSFGFQGSWTGTNAVPTVTCT